MSNPIISVLVPVYNVEKYISECIDSIINQTFKNIEIICVNDASTDSSLHILSEYAKLDDRIKIINKDKNEGLLLARKSAVLQAKGQYIVFVDSDDLLHSSDSLAIMHKMMTEENVDILQFNINLLLSNGDLQLDTGWFQTYKHKLFSNQEIISACVNNRYNWCLWNKIYKADVCIKAYQAIKDVYLVAAEDCYAYFLIAYYSQTFIGKSTEPLYDYRQGTGVTSQSNLDLSRFEMFCKENLITSWLEDFLKENKIFNYSYQEILNTLSQRFLSHCFGRMEQIQIHDREYALSLIFKYFSSREMYFYMKSITKYDDLNQNHESSYAYQIKEFNIGKYLRTKILSKITWGQTRRKFSDIYQHQKTLYKMIKSGQVTK